jgi:hypothetical protein
VDRVLEQYDALKEFFQLAVNRVGNRSNWVGDIHRLLQSNITRCDLLFLHSCLKPLNSFEKLFQGVSLFTVNLCISDCVNPCVHYRDPCNATPYGKRCPNLCANGSFVSCNHHAWRGSVRGLSNSKKQPTVFQASNSSWEKRTLLSPLSPNRSRIAS